MTAARSRHGRLSLLAKLGLFVMVALVLLASLLFYAQTRHGFRVTSSFPLAVKLTGAKLEVQDGLLSLMGALEVDGLLYEDPTSGVSHSPWNGWRSALCHGRLSRKVCPGSTSWSSSGQICGSSSDQGAANEAGSGERTWGWLWRSAKYQSQSSGLDSRTLTVAVEQGDRRITGQVTAVLDKLGPARAGNITLQTGFLLERDGTADLSGSTDLTLSVEVGPGRAPVEMERNPTGPSSGPAAVQSTPSDPEVVNFNQTLTGRYDGAAQSLRAVSNVTIGRGGAPSPGTVRADGL